MNDTFRLNFLVEFVNDCQRNLLQGLPLKPHQMALRDALSGPDYPTPNQVRKAIDDAVMQAIFPKEIK